MPYSQPLTYLKVNVCNMQQMETAVVTLETHKVIKNICNASSGMNECLHMIMEKFAEESKCLFKLLCWNLKNAIRKKYFCNFIVDDSFFV